MLESEYSPKTSVSTQTKHLFKHAKLIKLNVGGKVFMTTCHTLSRLPDSKLANLSDSDAIYDSDNDHYFFDRNPLFFDYILDAYRRDHVHVPHNLCAKMLQEELTYWKIPEEALSSCCWRTYKCKEYDNEALDNVEKLLVTNPIYRGLCGKLHNFDDTADTSCRRARLLVWNFLEDPTSSTGARIWGIMFLILVSTSAFTQAFLTHPDFRHLRTEPLFNVTKVDINPKLRMYLTTDANGWLTTIDQVCLAVFMLEFIVRFISCPQKTVFFRSIYTYVDILALIPMLISNLLLVIEPQIDDRTLPTVMFILSVLSVFRVLRLIKFARHYIGMRIMLLSLKASLREIFLLCVLMSIGTLIFATLIYFAEFNVEGGDFEHVPIGFWWSIVTMTTVGYGDRYPQSIYGYIIGTICAFSGMLATGLPIPIIANNFTNYYSYAKIARTVPKPLLHKVIKCDTTARECEDKYLNNDDSGSFDSAEINSNYEGNRSIPSNTLVISTTIPGSADVYKTQTDSTSLELRSSNATHRKRNQISALNKNGHVFQ